jgi:26S proteasome regulatory subunit N5
MIEECCTYVDKINNKDTQLQYIDTLRTVTAGKVIHLNQSFQYL